MVINANIWPLSLEGFDLQDQELNKLRNFMFESGTRYASKHLKIQVESMGDF